MMKFSSACTSSSSASLTVCGTSEWKCPSFTSGVLVPSFPLANGQISLAGSFLSPRILHSPLSVCWLTTGHTQACLRPLWPCCLFSLKVCGGFPLLHHLLLSPSCCCCVSMSGPSSDLTYPLWPPEPSWFLPSRSWLLPALTWEV